MVLPTLTIFHFRLRTDDFVTIKKRPLAGSAGQKIQTCKNPQNIFVPRDSKEFDGPDYFD